MITVPTLCCCKTLLLHNLHQVFCNWNDGKDAKCLTTSIIQRDTARVCLAINWVIRGVRIESRKTWKLIIKLYNSTVFHLLLLVGQSVLLICVSYDNLHQFTNVKWSVSQCCVSQRFLMQVPLRDLANFTLLLQIKTQRLLLVNC